MIKKVIFMFLLFVFAVPAYAEKIPVKIAPVQIISTNHDEIEVGDKITFEVVNDVYKDNKLFIKKGSTVKGTIDFVHPNVGSATLPILNY